MMYCVPRVRATQCSHTASNPEHTDCALGPAELTCPPDCCGCPKNMLIETDEWDFNGFGHGWCRKRCIFCPNEGEVMVNQINQMYNEESASLRTFFDEDYPPAQYCFDGCKRPNAIYSGNYRITHGDALGSCGKCLSGKYQDGATQDDCKQCPVAKYATGSGELNPPSGITSEWKWSWGNIQCDWCPVGKTSPSGHTFDLASQCVNCVAGKYRPGNYAGDCRNCPAGKMSAAGADSEEDCEESSCGTYLDGSAEVLCPRGHYALAGSSSCTPCNFPQYTSNAGSCQCSECVKTSGFVGGRYITKDGNEAGYRRCLLCPNGKTDTTHAYFSDKPDEVYADATALQIDEKLSDEVGKCVNCPANHWKDTQDRTPFCIACTGGKYSLEGHFESIWQRGIACTPCVEGDGHEEMPGCDQYASSPECNTEDPVAVDAANGNFLFQMSIRRSLGYVSHVDNLNDILGFNTGPWAALRGKGCVACPAGKFSMLAYDITFSNGRREQARVCQKCMFGKYTAAGATGTFACTSCSYKEYTISQGTVGVENCLSVPAGKILNQYRSGFEDCPTGTIAVDTGTSLECQYCSQPDEFASVDGGVTCGNCAAGEMLLKSYDKPSEMQSAAWEQLWSDQNPNLIVSGDRIQWNQNDDEDNLLHKNLAIEICIPCRPPYWCPDRLSTQIPNPHYPYTLWSLSFNAVSNELIFENRGIYQGFQCSETSDSGEVLIIGASSPVDCVVSSNLQVVNQATDDSNLYGLSSYYECDVGYGRVSSSHLLVSTSLPSITDPEYPKCDACVTGKYSTAYDSSPCLNCNAVDTCVGVDARFFSGQVDRTLWGQVVPGGIYVDPVRYNCGADSGGVCGCPYASGWIRTGDYPNEKTFCEKLSMNYYLSEEWAEDYNQVFGQNVKKPGEKCDLRYSSQADPNKQTHCQCDTRSFNIKSDTDWSSLTYQWIKIGDEEISDFLWDNSVAGVSNLEGVTDFVGNCHPCPAGQYRQRVGTYEELYGTVYRDVCISCPAGTKRAQHMEYGVAHAHNPNRASCVTGSEASCSAYEFIADLVCEACTAGSEPNAAQDGCVRCGVGLEWSYETNNCQPCPALYTRPQALVDDQDGRGDLPTCGACQACTDPDEPIMIACGATDGLSTCEECPCTVGVQYCASANSQSCSNCDAAQCEAGKTLSQCGGLDSGTCELCGEGSFNLDGGACLTCTPCEALYRRDQACSADSDSVCEECPVGQWTVAGNIGGACQVCYDTLDTQFDPCCEYSHISSRWWCGASGTSNDFLEVHGLELDTTDEHSASWQCSTKCGDTPRTGVVDENCPTQIHVKVMGSSYGRTVDFYKSNQNLACQLCEERWSIDNGFIGDNCELGTILVGCGGSSSTAAGACQACAAGEYHDACTDTCVGLAAANRVVVVSVSVSSIPNGYSCQIGQPTESEEFCGVFATSWDATFDADTGASSDTECHCSEGNANNAQGNCEQCAANTYGVVISKTSSEARKTECEDCPDGSGHNQLGQVKAGCLCSPGFEVTDSGGEFSCETCNTGKFKAQRSTEAHLEVGFSMPVAGSRLAINQCQLCEAGTYQDETGASDCKVCPVGFYCPLNTANPNMCENFKTTDAGAQQKSDCFCDETFSVTDPQTGNCVTKDEFCEANFYATEQSCAASCENGVTQANVDEGTASTADCASTALSHAEALASSHDTATASDIWLQEALLRVAWMQGANVNLEVMPYPTDSSDPVNPVHRIAVIYETTFYEELCKPSETPFKPELLLTHTYVLGTEWTDACTGAAQHSQSGCPHVAYRTIPWADLPVENSFAAPNADFAYWVLDNIEPPNTIPPTLTWTDLCIENTDHCTSNGLTNILALFNAEASFSSFATTGNRAQKKSNCQQQCTDNTACSLFASGYYKCYLYLEPITIQEALDSKADVTSSNYDSYADVVFKGSTHTANPHADYFLNEVSMQWSTALLQCVEHFQQSSSNPIYVQSWLVEEATDVKWNPTASWPGRYEGLTNGANNVMVMFVGGLSDITGSGALFEIEGAPSTPTRSAGNSLLIEECNCVTDDCEKFCRLQYQSVRQVSGYKYNNAVRFVRTPPRQTLPRHRAPGLRDGVNAGNFFDRRPTVRSIIPDDADPCSEAGSGTYVGGEHEGNVLCFEMNALESDIVTFSDADGACAADAAVGYPCYENIETCLDRAHAILLPAPYKETGSSLFEYDTTVLHMPYSATAHAENVFSGTNGAVFDFVPIYGYILEVRSGDCGADEVQKRVYMPLDVEKSVSTIGADCGTLDTAGAFTGMASSQISTDYTFLSVLSVYWAELTLDAAKTFVRMRTWTAYGYSEPSEWQALLDLSRICKACPANSKSPISSDDVNDCLCDAGYTQDTVGGETVCVECVSGKYKAAAGNGECTKCSETNNYLWVSQPGSQNSDTCAQTDPTLTESKISNFGASEDIHPIVVCVNLATATLRALAGFLIEYDCVAINPCPAAGDALQPDTWYHRNNTALELENEPDWKAADTIFNHYHIEYARIPLGVIISTAAPNFLHYKESDEWQPDTSTIQSVLGTCDQSNVIDCVQDIRQRNDKNDYTGADLAKSYTEGTTQMIKFTIHPSFTCNNVADDGQRLITQTHKPALQEPCIPAQTHGAYTSTPSECTLACNAGYETKEDDDSGICKRTCNELKFPQTTCPGFEAAHVPADVCADQNYFKCHACSHLDGYESHDFDINHPTVCQRTACGAGHTTPVLNGVCVPCPVHTKQVGTKCEPCTVGVDHQPNAGSNTCITCAWLTASPSCEAGFYAVQDFDEIQQYLLDAANDGVLPGTDLQKHAWCAQGYACLPCMPGKFKSTTAAADACTSCPIGQYQNTHGQTACFDCATAADEQVTAAEGSTESAQCLCNLGYEPPTTS